MWQFTDDKEEYTYNLVVDPIKAPVSSEDIVGSLEVIDQNGNVIKEVDVIVKEEVKKANILQLFTRAFNTITSGFPI